ncbi:MAG: serine hydrolase domain-containing protein [Ignavibacteria bacterium]
MKTLGLILILFLNVCSSQTIDLSEEEYSNGKESDKIIEAQRLIDSLMTEKKIPGLSVCVGTKDEILWAQGFGYSDPENKIPVKLNSIFRIGSISKTLTALALGKLLENNRMSLNDSVQMFVSYFPNKKYPVTIGALSSHTAGIRDYNYRNNEYISDKYYSTVEESINIFKDDSLIFEPGTKYGYSTYGYVLLSAVIESITEMDFLKYMNDSIFIPMNLLNTLPDFNDSIIPQRVKFFDESKGEIVNGYKVDNSNKWAGGGYLSNPYDLLVMSQNLLNHQFLSEVTVEKLWTSDTLLDGEEVNYGIGWKIETDSLQRKFVHHGGSSIGGRSFLLVLPNENIIVAITCNLSTNFDQSFVLKIADVFLN